MFPLGRQIFVDVNESHKMLEIYIGNFTKCPTTGKPIPTKTGITLTCNEWERLKATITDVDRALFVIQADKLINQEPAHFTQGGFSWKTLCVQKPPLIKHKRKQACTPSVKKCSRQKRKKNPLEVPC